LRKAGFCWSQSEINFPAHIAEIANVFRDKRRQKPLARFEPL
jgi:hypothetical protein